MHMQMSEKQSPGLVDKADVQADDISSIHYPCLQSLVTGAHPVAKREPAIG